MGTVVSLEDIGGWRIPMDVCRVCLKKLLGFL